MWYCVVLTVGATNGEHNQRIVERKHNTQDDSRTNSKEMKELLGYMARHHEDLEKTFSEEQKEIFEKFHDCWGEYASLGECAIFCYAFKLGARLMLEALTN